METVTTVKFDGKLVISGIDRVAVEAAARALAAKGAKILSQVEALGRKWMVTCEDPENRIHELSIIKLGLQLMIKGPTQAVVQQKVQELVEAGAVVLSQPSEATGGGWVAICDDAAQVHRW